MNEKDAGAKFAEQVGLSPDDVREMNAAALMGFLEDRCGPSPQLTNEEFQDLTRRSVERQKKIWGIETDYPNDNL